MKKINKNILILLLSVFAFFKLVSYAESEIPNTLIYENPNIEVTTIESKKQKEAAEMNISVTKINEKNMEVLEGILDEDKKEIHFNLKNNKKNIKMDSNDAVFVTDNLLDIPNVSTPKGRKSFSDILKDKFRGSGNGFTYEMDSIKDNLVVKYTKKIKDIYIGVVNTVSGYIKALFSTNVEGMKVIELDIKDSMGLYLGHSAVISSEGNIVNIPGEQSVNKIDVTGNFPSFPSGFKALYKNVTVSINGGSEIAFMPKDTNTTIDKTAKNIQIANPGLQGQIYIKHDDGKKDQFFGIIDPVWDGQTPIDSVLTIRWKNDTGKLIKIAQMKIVANPTLEKENISIRVKEPNDLLLSKDIVLLSTKRPDSWSVDLEPTDNFPTFATNFSTFYDRATYQIGNDPEIDLISDANGSQSNEFTFDGFRTQLLLDYTNRKITFKNISWNGVEFNKEIKLKWYRQNKLIKDTTINLSSPGGHRIHDVNIDVKDIDKLLEYTGVEKGILISTNLQPIANESVDFEASVTGGNDFIPTLDLTQRVVTRQTIEIENEFTETDIPRDGRLPNVAIDSGFRGLFQVSSANDNMYLGFKLPQWNGKEVRKKIIYRWYNRNNIEVRKVNINLHIPAVPTDNFKVTFNKDTYDFLNKVFITNSIVAIPKNLPTNDNKIITDGDFPNIQTPGFSKVLTKIRVIYPDKTSMDLVKNTNGDFSNGHISKNIGKNLLANVRVHNTVAYPMAYILADIKWNGEGVDETLTFEYRGMYNNNEVVFKTSNVNLVIPELYKKFTITSTVTDLQKAIATDARVVTRGQYNSEDYTNLDALVNNKDIPHLPVGEFPFNLISSKIGRIVVKTKNNPNGTQMVVGGNGSDDYETPGIVEIGPNLKGKPRIWNTNNVAQQYVGLGEGGYQWNGEAVNETMTFDYYTTNNYIFKSLDYNLIIPQYTIPQNLNIRVTDTNQLLLYTKALQGIIISSDLTPYPGHSANFEATGIYPRITDWDIISRMSVEVLNSGEPAIEVPRANGGNYGVHIQVGDNLKAKFHIYSNGSVRDDYIALRYPEWNGKEVNETLVYKWYNSRGEVIKTTNINLYIPEIIETHNITATIDGSNYDKLNRLFINNSKFITNNSWNEADWVKTTLTGVTDDFPIFKNGFFSVVRKMRITYPDKSIITLNAGVHLGEYVDSSYSVKNIGDNFKSRIHMDNIANGNIRWGYHFDLNEWNGQAVNETLKIEYIGVYKGTETVFRTDNLRLIIPELYKKFTINTTVADLENALVNNRRIVAHAIYNRDDYTNIKYSPAGTDIPNNPIGEFPFNTTTAKIGRIEIVNGNTKIVSTKIDGDDFNSGVMMQLGPNLRAIPKLWDTNNSANQYVGLGEGGYIWNGHEVNETITFNYYTKENYLYKSLDYILNIPQYVEDSDLNVTITDPDKFLEYTHPSLDKGLIIRSDLTPYPDSSADFEATGKYPKISGWSHFAKMTVEVKGSNTPAVQVPVNRRTRIQIGDNLEADFMIYSDHSILKDYIGFRKPRWNGKEVDETVIYKWFNAQGEVIKTTNIKLHIPNIVSIDNVKFEILDQAMFKNNGHAYIYKDRSLNNSMPTKTKWTGTFPEMTAGFTNAINRVEVSSDNGQTWQNMPIQTGGYYFSPLLSLNGAVQGHLEFSNVHSGKPWVAFTRATGNLSWNGNGFNENMIVRWLDRDNNIIKIVNLNLVLSSPYKLDNTLNVEIIDLNGFLKTNTELLIKQDISSKPGSIEADVSGEYPSALRGEESHFGKIIATVNGHESELLVDIGGNLSKGTSPDTLVQIGPNLQGQLVVYNNNGINDQRLGILKPNWNGKEIRETIKLEWYGKGGVKYKGVNVNLHANTYVEVQNLEITVTDPDKFLGYTGQDKGIIISRDLTPYPDFSADFTATGKYPSINDWNILSKTTIEVKGKSGEIDLGKNNARKKIEIGNNLRADFHIYSDNTNRNDYIGIRYPEWNGKEIDETIIYRWYDTKGGLVKTTNIKLLIPSLIEINNSTITVDSSNYDNLNRVFVNDSVFTVGNDTKDQLVANLNGSIPRVSDGIYNVADKLRITYPNNNIVNVPRNNNLGEYHEITAPFDIGVNFKSRIHMDNVNDTNTNWGYRFSDNIWNGQAVNEKIKMEYIGIYKGVETVFRTDNVRLIIPELYKKFIINAEVIDLEKALINNSTLSTRAIYNRDDYTNLSANLDQTQNMDHILKGEFPFTLETRKLSRIEFVYGNDVIQTQLVDRNDYITPAMIALGKNLKSKIKLWDVGVIGNQYIGSEGGWEWNGHEVNETFTLNYYTPENYLYKSLDYVINIPQYVEVSDLNIIVTDPDQFMAYTGTNVNDRKGIVISSDLTPYNDHSANFTASGTYPKINGWSHFARMSVEVKDSGLPAVEVKANNQTQIQIGPNLKAHFRVNSDGSIKNDYIGIISPEWNGKEVRETLIYKWYNNRNELLKTTNIDLTIPNHIKTDKLTFKIDQIERFGTQGFSYIRPDLIFPEKIPHSGGSHYNAQGTAKGTYPNYTPGLAVATDKIAVYIKGKNVIEMMPKNGDSYTTDSQRQIAIGKNLKATVEFNTNAINGYLGVRDAKWNGKEVDETIIFEFRDKNNEVLKIFEWKIEASQLYIEDTISLKSPLLHPHRKNHINIKDNKFISRTDLNQLHDVPVETNYSGNITPFLNQGEYNKRLRLIHNGTVSISNNDKVETNDKKYAFSIANAKSDFMMIINSTAIESSDIKENFILEVMGNGGEIIRRLYVDYEGVAFQANNFELEVKDIDQLLATGIHMEGIGVYTISGGIGPNVPFGFSDNTSGTDLSGNTLSSNVFEFRVLDKKTGGKRIVNNNSVSADDFKTLGAPYVIGDWGSIQLDFKNVLLRVYGHSGLSGFDKLRITSRYKIYNWNGKGVDEVFNIPADRNIPTPRRVRLIIPSIFKEDNRSLTITGNNGKEFISQIGTTGAKYNIVNNREINYGIADYSTDSADFLTLRGREIFYPSSVSMTVNNTTVTASTGGISKQSHTTLQRLFTWVSPSGETEIEFNLHKSRSNSIRKTLFTVKKWNGEEIKTKIDIAVVIPGESVNYQDSISLDIPAIAKATGQTTIELVENSQLGKEYQYTLDGNQSSKDLTTKTRGTFPHGDKYTKKIRVEDDKGILITEINDYESPKDRAIPLVRNGINYEIGYKNNQFYFKVNSIDPGSKLDERLVLKHFNSSGLEVSSYNLRIKQKVAVTVINGDTLDFGDMAQNSGVHRQNGVVTITTSSGRVMSIKPARDTMELIHADQTTPPLQVTNIQVSNPITQVGTSSTMFNIGAETNIGNIAEGTYEGELLLNITID